MYNMNEPSSISIGMRSIKLCGIARRGQTPPPAILTQSVTILYRASRAGTGNESKRTGSRIRIETYI